MKKSSPGNRTMNRPPISSSKSSIPTIHAVKRGALLELLVKEIAADGRGVADYSGVRVYVAGTVTGDRCLVRVTHIGRTSVSAILQRFISLSSLRTSEPLCNDSEICQGCPLVPLKYDEQLKWKRDLVMQELSRHRELENINLLQPLPSEKKLGYRTTAKLVIAGSYTEPYIGIYRRATHDVVDLEDCKVHHPVVNLILNVVRMGISALKIPVWREKSRSGLLRYMVVRVSEYTEEAMVTFVTARRAFNEIHHLALYLQKAVPQVKVVSQNINSSEGNVIFGASDYFVTKQKTIKDTIGDVFVEISHRSFLQAQNYGARMIYGQVAEWASLDERKTALDLYCGIGGIALTLARSGGNVLGVELNRDAVMDASRNARINKLANCRFEAGDVSEILDELLEEGARFDIVVLNPPRKGCDSEIIAKVIGLRPSKIIYVSCSPESLARDLSILHRNNYVCKCIQPVDMFPQTAHIENIALVEPSP